MPDLRSTLAAATRRLGERTDAEALLLHLLSRPRSWLFTHAEDALDTDVQTAYAALVERRAAGDTLTSISLACAWRKALLTAS